MILKCSCRHDYQDNRYGKGRRVFNETSKGDANDRTYRCTVCSHETKKGNR